MSRPPILPAVLWAAAMFAWFFISALYLQLVLGYNAMQVGLSFLPANLIMAAFSLGLSAKIVMRFGFREPLGGRAAVRRGGPRAVRARTARRQLLDRRVARHDAARHRRGHRVQSAAAGRHERCQPGRFGPRLRRRQHGVHDGRRTRSGRAREPGRGADRRARWRTAWAPPTRSMPAIGSRSWSARSARRPRGIIGGAFMRTRTAAARADRRSHSLSRARRGCQPLMLAGSAARQLHAIAGREGARHLALAAGVHRPREGFVAAALAEIDAVVMQRPRCSRRHVLSAGSVSAPVNRAPRPPPCRNPGEPGRACSMRRERCQRSRGSGSRTAAAPSCRSSATTRDPAGRNVQRSKRSESMVGSRMDDSIAMREYCQCANGNASSQATHIRKSRLCREMRSCRRCHGGAFNAAGRARCR